MACKITPHAPPARRTRPPCGPHHSAARLRVPPSHLLFPPPRSPSPAPAPPCSEEFFLFDNFTLYGFCFDLHRCLMEDGKNTANLSKAELARRDDELARLGRETKEATAAAKAAQLAAAREALAAARKARAAADAKALSAKHAAAAERRTGVAAARRMGGAAARRTGGAAPPASADARGMQRPRSVDTSHNSMPHSRARTGPPGGAAAAAAPAGGLRGTQRPRSADTSGCPLPHSRARDDPNLRLEASLVEDLPPSAADAARLAAHGLRGRQRMTVFKPGVLKNITNKSWRSETF